MPAKKQTAKKTADIPAPNPETGRQPAAPDGSNVPMNYDERGDAHPLPVDPDHSPEANRPDGSAMPKTVDPLLSPEAQQPGESAEDYAKRQAAQPQPAGSYDASVTRGQAPS